MKNKHYSNSSVDDKSYDADEVDLYRDTYVRYMGYANELGEAFRPNFPRLVLPSYGVSFAYVFMDTFDKASKANIKSKGNSATIIEAAVDTMLWQSFASVIIPGFVIHKIVDFTTAGTRKMQKIPPSLNNPIP